MATAVKEDVQTEIQKIEAWRMHVLIEAGYPEHLASQLAERSYGADAIDLHRAVELLAQGCSPQTAGEILL